METLFLLSHVADAAVVRPGGLWGDAFLTEGHGGDVNSVLKAKTEKEILRLEVHPFSMPAPSRAQGVGGLLECLPDVSG